MPASAITREAAVASIMACAAILGACQLHRITELHGAYVADYEVAEETLVLKADGTFVQKVVLKSTGRMDTTSGTWSYDTKGGYVVFEKNFMLVLDGFRELRPDYVHPSRGIVVKPVDSIWGRIRIGSPEGVIYRKIS